MQCLNCHTEMVNNDVITKDAELSYDMCEKCGSLWLDAGELDKMAFKVEGSIESSSEIDDKAPVAQIRKCPRCEDFDLSQAKFCGYTDIVLDRCKNCGGFWLDGGELNLINEHLTKIMPVSGHGFSDFVNNAHVPYWFRRIQKTSSETDFHVAVLPMKGATLLKPSGHKCPACASPLDLYSISSMEFEGCPNCKGLWLVKDELRKLKNQTEDGRLRWMNAEIENVEKTNAVPTSRPCVQCDDVKLVCVVFGHSSVAIDWCPRCHGIWLDRREFDSIIEYLSNEEIATPVKEMGKEVVKDLKRIVTGGPESRLAEIVDTEAAISAMLNTAILEHSSLTNLFMRIGQAGHSIGA